MGDAPQLDLVVVGDEERESRRRHERPSECPTGLGTYRDVVEVGGVGAEAAGAGDSLVERGPDPISLPHLGEEALAVGRPQLLDLPVRQELLDDGMVVSEPLKGGRIGGISGLRLLARRQPELLEQDLPELLGGVDVELLPGSLMDGGTEEVAFGGELVAQTGEFGHVDAHADLLHPGQHPDQRQLDVSIQPGDALPVDGCQHRLDEEFDRPCPEGSGIDARDRVAS